MATKRNRAGNQQPYVPEGNGDASGEYTNNESGTISTSTKTKSTISNSIKESGTPAEREKLSNMGIDSFFKTNIEDEVKRRKGQTWNWKETGYILTDGYQLDLSGKRDGAPSGQRSDDHRDIFESEDYMEDGNIDNTDAMVKFMGRGNIRVSPEYPGINLQIEPTEEQYRKIYDMVARLGRDGFVVDFDNERGDNIGSLNYDDAVSPDRVIADMKHYFKTGEIEDY